MNIYEEYFDGLDPAPIVDRSHSRTMFVYKDVETPTVIFNWIFALLELIESDGNLISNHPTHISFLCSVRLAIFRGRPTAASNSPSPTATRTSRRARRGCRSTRTSGRRRTQTSRCTRYRRPARRSASSTIRRTFISWSADRRMVSAARGTRERAIELLHRRRVRFRIERASARCCGSTARPARSSSRAVPTDKSSGGTAAR